MKCLAAPLIALSAFLFSACQSAPPVPENRYYRVHASSATASPTPVLKAEVVVLPLRAEGLYSERALLFSDGARTVQQYHYHHWLYAPNRLLQGFLADQFRQAGLATKVHGAEHRNEASYVVSGRIVNLERIVPQNKAQVTLELRLDKNGKRLWQQTYSSEEPMTENSIPAYVLATEHALQRIVADFVGDMRRARID